MTFWVTDCLVAPESTIEGVDGKRTYGTKASTVPEKPQLPALPVGVFLPASIFFFQLW